MSETKIKSKLYNKNFGHRVLENGNELVYIDDRRILYIHFNRKGEYEYIGMDGTIDRFDISKKTDDEVCILSEMIAGDLGLFMRTMRENEYLDNVGLVNTSYGGKYPSMNFGRRDGKWYLDYGNERLTFEDFNTALFNLLCYNNFI